MKDNGGDDGEVFNNVKKKTRGVGVCDGLVEGSLLMLMAEGEEYDDENVVRLLEFKIWWEKEIKNSESLNFSSFEVRELALYREEWERSLLIDWLEIWKVVEKLERGWDKNLKSSWKLKIGWDEKFWKAVRSLKLGWDSRS